MAHFEMSRSTTIAASPERIHALLDDFHAWQQWSPWEKVDPDLQRTYTGPAVDLRFLKPFKATNITRFDLTPSGPATRRGLAQLKSSAEAGA